MRPFEICLVVLIAGAAVFLMIGRWQSMGRLFVAAALIVALAHGILEGAHWQMIPAYAATGILCLMAWKFDGRGLRFSFFAACLILLLSGTSVAFSLVLPMFHLPLPTGPYPVGTTTLYFKDTSRTEDAAPVAGQPRELMVQIWYPAMPSSNRFARYREPLETRFVNSYQSQVLTDSRKDAPLASAGAPFPIVLFNHGWRGRRTQNTFLTEDLASHGYVVASIDHTYNAGLVAFPDGRVVRGTAAAEIAYVAISTPERVRAIWDKELSKWAADESFVLDRLVAMNADSSSSWHGRLNTDRVAAVGHSFGGAAAVQVCAQDARFRGGVNLDGWFFGAIRARGPNQPMLVMREAAKTPTAAAYADPATRVEAVLDATDAADLEGSLRKFGGYSLVVRGAYHEDFSDQPLLSPLRSVSKRGPLAASETHDIVKAYVLAFLDKTLRGENPPILDDQASPYPEVTYKAWPVPKDGANQSTQNKPTP